VGGRSNESADSELQDLRNPPVNDFDDPLRRQNGRSWSLLDPDTREWPTTALSRDELVSALSDLLPR
jgi:hypothetical protein